MVMRGHPALLNLTKRGCLITFKYGEEQEVVEFLNTMK